MRALSHIVVLTFIMCLSHGLDAQVFWSEDFAGDLPIEWESIDVSLQGVPWTWCRDPEAGETVEGCNGMFDFRINDQLPFSSSTATNGYAVVNSDKEELFVSFNSPHESRLTSHAIDCSDQEQVFIKFESHIGVGELDAGPNALFLVSNDNQNWTEFQPFPNLVPDGHVDAAFKRWSYNPQVSRFDISEIAAGQETVYLRWYWKANWEFYWALDDIELTSENILLQVDLTLKPQGSLHGIPSNFKTPQSQIEPVYLATDIGNNGTDPIEDVMVNAKVLNTLGESVYDETINIPLLLAGEIQEKISFPIFTPNADTGAYTIIYEVSNALEDDFDLDNLVTYNYEITEALFQKDNSEITTANMLPNLESWSNTDNLYPWSIANYFYLPKGNGYFLNEIEFGYPDNVPLTFNIFCNSLGETINIRLEEWEDANENGIAEKDERSLVGINEFVSTGSDGMDNIFSSLIDPFSGSPNIPLKDETAYLAILAYNPNRINQCFRTFGSSKLDYQGMLNYTSLNENPRYASLMAVDDDEDFMSPGLDPAAIPMIRMHIQEGPVSTQNISRDIQVFSISPIPSKDVIYIKYDQAFADEFEGLEIYNAIGQRLLETQIRAHQLDVSTFDAGAYFLKAYFDTGVSTELFIVEK